MIEVTFLKELMLIKQANQKSAIFATIGIFHMKVFSFNQMSVMHAMIYKLMSLSLSDNAISNIKGSDYRCIISRINKNEAIKLMKNDDLTDKMSNVWRYSNGEK